ncbi:hypothetical protein JMJ55_11985 [Belnapia sp. T6]|uniref:Uncharacterized protein n=1 Tax=Belnapia mucosa TaxID=2804532 RepID=A0ABS1V2X4_9PROT|nr:hypothetical protein [Belnapia mucosa]MBL6456047.1 hypothetical protein [Belnapia mucosa]
MILNPDEVAAARAIGCAFFPATELQVQRLTMQQRIFTVDGKRYLVSRDGSYFETVGTLRALLAKYVPPPPPPDQAQPEPAPVETAPPAAELPEPPPAEAEPAAAVPEPPPAESEPVAAAPELPPAEAEPAAEPAPAADATPRRRRPRKTTPPPPEPAPLPAPSAPEASAARSDRLARLARRMAGGELPRWQVAGAARRGRVKLF